MYSPSFPIHRFPKFALCLLLFCQLFLGPTARADDGYRLWLRYESLPAAQAAIYQSQITSLVATGESKTMEVIRKELGKALPGLLGRAVPEAKEVRVKRSTGHRHSEEPSGDRRTRAGRHAGKTRPGRFHHPLAENPRSRGDTDRFEFRHRRALRHVPLSQTAANPTAGLRTST